MPAMSVPSDEERGGEAPTASDAPNASASVVLGVAPSDAVVAPSASHEAARVSQDDRGARRIAAGLIAGFSLLAATNAIAITARVPLPPEGVGLRALHHAFDAAETLGLGALADRPDEVEVEIRASWTPPDGDLGPHLTAWATLLCTTAGLPPMPDGVTVLSRRH